MKTTDQHKMEMAVKWLDCQEVANICRFQAESLIEDHLQATYPLADYEKRKPTLRITNQNK